MGLTRLTRMVFATKIKRKIPKNNPAEEAITDGKTVKVSATGKFNRFSSSKNTALLNSRPNNRPPTMVIAAVYSVSKNRVAAMCRFWSPKML